MGGARCNWRPNLRWGDTLDKFWLKFEVTGGGWREKAQNRDDWSKLEDEFANAEV